MGELPPTIFIGIGAVIAAVITALISFINLITSKDQSISENRQKWIDSVRDDIAKFIGLSAHFTSRLNAIEHIEDEAKQEVLRRALFDSGIELPELYNRITLRLNPKENENILEDLKNIESFLAGDLDKPRHDVDYMETLTIALRNSAQEMLKKEWGRVKRGETSYFITKWVFILAISSSVMFGIDQVNSILKVNKETNAEVLAVTQVSPNKAIKQD